MADSYSTFLQVRLPQTGAYYNTWGATLNADAFNLLDAAISGWTVVSVGATPSYSLPALTPGAASISRYFCLLFVGTPPSLCTVTLPSSVAGKMYLINNQTGQTLLFTYAGSTATTTVPTGEILLIWCDGSNCWSVGPPVLDPSQFVATAALTAAMTTLNATLTADLAAVYAALALKAPIDSPVLTGIPQTPTAATATSSDQAASTLFVSLAIAAAKALL